MGVAKTQFEAHSREWQNVRPEKLAMWTPRAGNTPEFVIEMGRLNVDVDSYTVNLHGASDPADIARFHEYWRVRNQWVHSSGVLTASLRQSVPVIDGDGFFEEAGPDRCWVLGCHRSRENWQASAGAWQDHPLEQVLAHVNGVAKFIAEECEKNNACLKGLIVGGEDVASELSNGRAGT